MEQLEFHEHLPLVGMVLTLTREAWTEMMRERLIREWEDGYYVFGSGYRPYIRIEAEALSDIPAWQEQATAMRKLLADWKKSS